VGSERQRAWGVGRRALPAWTEQESREEQAVSRATSTDVAVEHADWADPVDGAADKGAEAAYTDKDRPSSRLQRQQCTQASPRLHH
jgi:hypothetical protein